MEKKKIFLYQNDPVFDFRPEKEVKTLLGSFKVILDHSVLTDYNVRSVNFCFGGIMRYNFLKKTGFSILILSSLISCSSSVRKVVRTSSSEMPKWIFSRPADSKNLYFVGVAEKAVSQKEGREKAISDAIYQVVQYIGFRVKTQRKDIRKMTEGDKGGTYEWQLKQTLEGKGDAKISVNVDDFYFEEYSDGTVNVSVLLKISRHWVDVERKRLAKRALAQRKDAEAWLSKAKSELKKKHLSAALQKFIQTWLISEQAVENADLMDRSAQLIQGIVGGFSVTLQNNPTYAYREGGSDFIDVKLANSGLAVKGIMMELFPVDGQVIPTDAYGKAVLVLEKAPNQNKVQIKAGWSLLPFKEIQKEDEEFYSQLKELRNRSAVSIELKLADRSKVMPTIVFAFKRLFRSHSKRYGSFEHESGLQQSIEGLLTQNGYSVQSLTLPKLHLSRISSPKALHKELSATMIHTYGRRQRILIALESVISLGHSVASAYGSDLESVEVKLSLTLINLTTGKVEKSQEFSTRKPGITSEQATAIAEKSLLKKFKAGTF